MVTPNSDGQRHQTDGIVSVLSPYSDGIVSEWTPKYNDIASEWTPKYNDIMLI